MRASSPFSLLLYIREYICVMYEAYSDNPFEIEKWIESLTPEQKDMFDKGYVIALCGLLEQICESKRKILNKIMELDTEDEDYEFNKSQLDSRLLLLEIYEKHYTYRAKHLTKRYNLTI